jgi:hypothetical protein
MSIHQLMYGLAYSIGNWAIPRDVDGYFGSMGTWGTCTAQGFLIYVCIRSAIGYYGLFSVYSYLGVLSGFNREKYQWCEKWIHIFVPVYPIVTGVYYLATQNYNPGYGFCRLASYPLGCDRSEDVFCERGPASTGFEMFFVSWMIPCIPFVFIPTILMVVLYLKVKKREQDAGENYLIRSREIAIQSCLYLVALYWTLLPFFIATIVFGHFMKVRAERLVVYVMLSQLNMTLFVFGKRNHPRIEDLMTDPASKNMSIRESIGSDFIFNAGESSSRMIENSKSFNSPTTKTAKQAPPEPEKEEFTFNIFDGTNASGAYAEYIHGGDSEDKRMDDGETDHWNAVQNHI